MSIILLAWLLIAALSAIYNIKISIMLLIAYGLLVPYSTFSFLGIPIEYNYIILIVFAIFIFKAFLIKEKLDYSIIRIFVIFISLVLFSAIFAVNVDFGAQIDALRIYIIRVFLLPIMIWQLFKEEKDINFLIKTIVGCLSVMLIYGIYCFIIKSNPYVSALSLVFQKKDYNDAYADLERSGLSGRISSTTFHPFLWSAILSMSLIASIIIYNSNKKLLFFFFITLIFINALICGVRTGIVAALVGGLLLIYLIPPKIKGLFLLALILWLIAGADTSLFGKYQDFVDSIIFFYNPKNDIGGSSLSMRISQLEGAYRLWQQGGLFFGNGFGWCSYYLIKHGDHPVLLAFESVIYIALIENGLTGTIIWGGLFYSLFKINRRIFQKYGKRGKFEFWVINSFMASYFTFSLVSGIIGLNFFLIFLVIIFKKVISKYNTSTIYIYAPE